MSVIKSGDLVVLKSGGPTMTVDTVNTDIFDDNKITGVLCVWFVGDKLERVRLDRPVIEPHALELVPDKPDAEHAGDLVVIENVGVDRIHGHGRTTGFQHHEIARLDNAHL